MTSNQKQHYHHGDLYKSLLDAATKLLREGGVEALSMRKLADRVGVSRMAPYHHFKDKNDLLCAIAEQGFRLQEGCLSECEVLPTAAALKTYVLTYIRFSQEHAETYDLMFGRDIWKTGVPTESLKQVSKVTFKRWLDWIERLQRERVLSADDSALRVAQSSWAGLHGLCRLFNDGIYLNPEDLDAIACTLVNSWLEPSSIKR
ncbi:TetR/AcrR family transcriptional regulator [Nitrincola alkalisediminis]|uniref:TetR/AcrR family transcriptional regulator n=1 Tax=Nitrincola alkalisediminis TaxID=1366656 RepID=UPI0018752A9D|nr:TetR/AcrR family transcriptional regulator [Nitrincola alkalisediminis]